ncbi:MAG: efflux RND transporter permease subunit [Pirellulales bacterium]|nr:efflux RND transporter permease subunit [Pirellulales bacterium]
MSLIDAFVRNPVKISVGVLLVALFGYQALVRMPMQLTPEVQTPTITVTTRWPGASPQEVEREIVIEQEEQLVGVEGATKLSSESTDSQGTITIEFQVGTNMEEALLKVNSRLQQVPEYPEDADQPVITTANSASRPIGWFILSTAPPDEAKLADFAHKYPELAEKLVPVRKAKNIGLKKLRLRNLAKDDERFNELLPPPDLDVTKLRRFAEDEIEARFERVDGVSQSNVIGGLIDELQVVIDPEKLAARQITMSTVRAVLQSQNRDTSAGDFWEDKRRYVTRTLGQFRSPEQVENQLLAIRDGGPVFVHDVAEVRLGYKKPDGLVRRFGEGCIAINCIRSVGANVLDVMAGLRETTATINREILAPRGLSLVQVYDETEYIDSSVNLVKENIYFGGALTMAVLMAFLHMGARTVLTIPAIVALGVAAAYFSPWWFAGCLAVIVGSGFWFARGSLVVGLAIPTSIIGTFLVLGMLGRSLNVISLAGLAFAVGMLVDNAIVVLENIFRRHDDLGETPLEAAVRGTQEVWGAVVASTLTTVAVFLPVVFIQEEAGQLFRDIALAIAAAVALSMIVSVTVIPTAAARLFRGESRGLSHDELAALRNGSPAVSPDRPLAAKSASRAGAVVRLAELLGQRLSQSIAGANAWIQRGVLRRAAVVLVLVGTSLGISWALWPQVEYLPSGNRNLVFGILLPPPGYNTDQLISMGTIVEEGLRPYWDVDPTAAPDDLDGPVIDDFFFVARGRSVFVGLRALDPLRAGELVPLVQQVGRKLPGTFAVAKQTSLFEDGLTAGRTIDVEITGPDVEKLVALGGQIIGQVSQKIPGVQALPKPSLDLSNPEVHVVPRLVQAAQMQMTTSDIGFAVNALVDGAYVSDYFLDGKKIDLTIVGESKYADATHLIGAAPLATPLGNLVPLNALADISLASGPEQINHRERVRAITIEASPPPEVALEDAMRIIDEEIVAPIRATGQLGDAYRITLEGTADKLGETWRALRGNVILALTITYLLMAALFESWLYPLVVILTVPLGAVGGILGLRVLNEFVLQPLDVLTMLGFVVLIGTVVNNPILIVHQALNHIREDGMTPGEAVTESVRTRIRPIFMTTTTTVLGLLPLVLFPGAGSELYRGLGSVVLGGLLASTVFTLVLAPTLFTLALDAKRLVLGLWRHRGARPQAPPSGEEPATEEPELVAAAR